MALETIGTVFTLASAAFSVVNGLMGYISANQQAAQARAIYDQNVEIARRNAQMQNDEILRQERQALEETVQRQQDRQRVANAELGTLRVLQGEMGMTGLSFDRLLLENSYGEGLDLTRMATGYKRALERGEADRANVASVFDAAVRSQGAQLMQAQSQARSAGMSSLIGGLGSAIQIGTGWYTDGIRARAQVNAIQARSASAMSANRRAADAARESAERQQRAWMNMDRRR